jgi:hypothetical protein
VYGVRQRRSRASRDRLLVLGPIGGLSPAARRACRNSRRSQKKDHDAFQQEIEQKHLDD